MHRITAPVLVVGGTGVVGSATAAHLSRRQPRIEVVAAGRSSDVPADTALPGLGLPAGRAFGAVVNLAPDPFHHVHRFAQEREVPLVSLIGGPHSLAEEITVHSAHRGDATFVHAGHWAGGLVGALALQAAERLRSVETLTVVAVLDPRDRLGPAATDGRVWREFEAAHPFPFTAGGGGWNWTTRHTRRRVPFTTVSGDLATAWQISTTDVLGLGEALRPALVRFAAADDEDSAGTLVGAPPSHDVVFDLTGTNRHRSPVAHRLDLRHPRGFADLTGLSAALLTERVLGLNGGLAPRPGFHDAITLLSSLPLIGVLEELGSVVRHSVSLAPAGLPVPGR
ncbi:hypothetical protein [Kineococcus sp. SYSU DK001]|uniref:hypothetical protein n=1 Tax=Kineococcus sp. SYSU DK001 TaxID=3383122 RepID=UPI003D7DF578